MSEWAQTCQSLCFLLNWILPQAAEVLAWILDELYESTLFVILSWHVWKSQEVKRRTMFMIETSCHLSILIMCASQCDNGSGSLCLFSRAQSTIGCHQSFSFNRREVWSWRLWYLWPPSNRCEGRGHLSWQQIVNLWQKIELMSRRSPLFLWKRLTFRQKIPIHRLSTCVLAVW